MRKMIILVLLAALLVFGGIAHASEPTTTILMYMCGTDLQAQCVYDLYEMCSLDIPENINLVILAGGSDEWDDPDLVPNALNRFVIRNHRFEEMEVLDWANMGEAQTLYDFIDFGLSNYPADRNMLVLWDHGLVGAAGVCSDETAGGDCLSMGEVSLAIGSAMEEYGDFMFDMIGFDACLMGSYEAALSIVGYADYMVASPELESGLGWAYDVWLQDLIDDPYISMPELGRSIADSYCEVCLEYIPGDAVGLSVCDLNAILPVRFAVEEMGASLYEALEDGYLTEISRARQQMYAFGEFFDSSADMVDMVAFADAYAAFNPEAAAELKAAVEDCVVYETNSGMFDVHSGLSILFPLALLEDMEYYLPDYDPNELTQNYTLFLHEYVNQMTGSDYVFSAYESWEMDSSELESEAFLQSVLDAFSAPVDWTEYEDAEDYDGADTSGGAGIPGVDSILGGSGAGIPGVDSILGGSGASGISGVDAILSGSADAADIASIASILGISSGDAAAEELFGFTMSVSEEDLQYLSYVEGMLLLEVDDGEDYFLIDLGYMRNAWVDWNGGMIYSLFDGSWPMMGDQMIAIYDQAKNEHMRRSIIPAMVNGVDCYLVAVFEGPDARSGRVIGYSQGFDENGLPVRGVTALEEGDSIIPTYTMFFWDENDEMQETWFEGDEIFYDGELTVDYEYIAGLEDDEMQYLHCFCLNDIFGDYQLSDFVDFD